MKIRKKMLILIGGLTSVIVPAIAVACNYNKTTTNTNSQPVTPPGTQPVMPPETHPGSDKLINVPPVISPNDKKLERVASPLLIKENQEINYVALGDSITAGFDGTLDKDYRGEKLTDGTIDGLSYPAFLARALNVNGRVKSFENYAITGSTLELWNTILFAKGYYVTQDRNQLKENTFGKDYENIISKMKEKLSDSNLITFTLGANDLIRIMINVFFMNGGLSNLTSSAGKDSGFLDILKKFQEPFNFVLNYLRDHLEKFIENLKEMAPKANINIIGYPLPFLKLARVINDLVRSKTKFKNFDFYTLFNKEFNGALKNVATESGVNFINAFNYDYWIKNDEKEKLTNVAFDIHPGVKGYKKMALDIYLKITNQYYNKEQFDALGDYDFSQKFINQDFKTAKYQIAVNNYKNVLDNVFGDSSEKYIDNNTVYEQKVEPLISTENFGKRIKVLLVGFSRAITKLFIALSKTEKYRQIDDKGLLFDFLMKKIDVGIDEQTGFMNQETRLQLLFQAIINTKLVDTLLAYINSDLEKLINSSPPGKVIDFKDITDILLKNIKKPDIVVLIIQALGTEPFSKHFLKFIGVLSQVFKNSSPEKKEFLKNIGLGSLLNLLGA